MSGFAVLYHRAGQPANESVVSEMTAAMAHRGPDGSRVWVDGAIGLGHCMLRTTPESVNEQIPAHRGSGELAITCDARIDNRSELIRALSLSGSALEISDSSLILSAYEKWGVDCPSHLVGDFAFVIWDRRRNHLFCARDPMGVKSMYYYADSGMFTAGSEIKALMSVPGVPRRLNEVRVLDYLVNLFDDRTITFYKDVVRLPAATLMIVTPDRITTRIYWSLDSKRELKLGSDREYAEAFRECFTEAVRCRMRSAYPVAAALSGGLDSSSIACTAREIRRSSGDNSLLDTYSLIFPGLPPEDLRFIDERGFMQQVLDTGGFQPHFIRADELSPMKDVEKVQFHLDEPFCAGNLYLHWAMFGAVQSSGARVFLDGLDGDTTVSHGFEYLADLILGLRWPTLFREIKLINRNLKMGRKKIIRDYCLAPLCPGWVYKLAYRLLRGRKDARITAELVLPEFKERMGLVDRVNSLLASTRSCTATSREKHAEMLGFPLFAHTLEMTDKVAAPFHLEPRYPFFDQRLIEFCLSLPTRQKLNNGWSRAILRRAMEGILPPAIQWRPAKGNLSPNFYRRFLEGDRGLVESSITQGRSPALEAYIDFPAIRRAFQSYETSPLYRHDESLQIFGALNLAMWLESAGLKP